MLEQRISRKDKHRPGSFIDQGNNEVKFQVISVSSANRELWKMITISNKKYFRGANELAKKKCLAFNLTFMRFTWFRWFVLSSVVTSCARQTTLARKKCRSYMTMAPLPKKSQRVTAEVVRIARGILTSRLFCRRIRNTSIVTWEFQLNRLPKCRG